MAENRSDEVVICFGEVLWDCLPDGRFVGGAPLNVAYHMTKLGSAAWPASSVGDDELGHELLDQIRARSLPTDLVGVVKDRPTGVVNVTFDNGSPTYDIVTNVAWDRIEVPAEMPPVSAVVFGSLALRSEHNHRQLLCLLALSPGALGVFDVNIRPPYGTHELVWMLASHADLVKLNDDEAASLLGVSPQTDDLEQSARSIAERFSARLATSSSYEEIKSCC